MNLDDASEAGHALEAAASGPLALAAQEAGGLLAGSVQQSWEASIIR